MYLVAKAQSIKPTLRYIEAGTRVFDILHHQKQFYESEINAK